MSERERLLQELEQASDELIIKTLNFVRLAQSATPQETAKNKSIKLPEGIAPIDVAELQKQIPQTSEERSRRWREWLAAQPGDHPALPEEAMHRDTMYD